ncbi:transporter substrate-binding domain-containing protein [Pseudemcibacter sp.]|uniref:transporter substrate-binding domain-containing protein n=1 Tax=Pseudemcibacter sp. TaxID=2943293 RepID=UPI003F6A1214
MIKFIIKKAYLFCFIILGICDIHAQSNINFTQEELKWIEDHPVITSTNEVGWAPLDFNQFGEARGFSVDYLNLVAKKVGIKIEYKSGFTWSQILEKLKNKEIDIAQSIIYTPERAEYLEFTRPYLDMPMVFFGRKGQPRIETIEDLKDLKIGATLGDLSYEIYKNDYPELDIYEYNSTIDALKDISIGKIDVFADIYPVSNFILNQNFLSGVTVVGDSFFLSEDNTDNIRLAVRNDWPILRIILEKGMDAITPKEFSALAEKWQTTAAALTVDELEYDIGLTEAELEWLNENKVIKVATDPNNTPLEFIDDNENISGLAGSYLELFEQRLNVKFEWSGSKNWTESLNQIQSKKAHMVSTANATPDREEYLIFTDPFLDVSYMIFGRQGEEIYGNLDALNGKTVSMVKGYSITKTIADNHPKIILRLSASVAEALEVVAIGQADAYVGSIALAAHFSIEKGLTQIVAVGGTPYRGSNKMAVRKDLPLLASAIQKAMQSVTAREKTEITRKWLGRNFESFENSTLLIRAMIICFIILSLILIWNYSLRREVNQRKKAEAEADAANIAKSKFLANMSHELRIPLNAIIGFSDAMLAGIAGEIKEPKQKDYLNDIRSSGEHLLTVINDILDLSKIEAGKWRLNITEFVLNNSINETINMMMPLADQKNISLKYQCEFENADLKVKSDIHVLKRILINLLSNAIKFTENNGNVYCRAYLKGNSINIEIIDDGIGIPSSRLDKVLHPFEQVQEGYDLNEEGTGLGLAIVNELLNLIDGALILESEVSKGTKVTITIPK